MENTTKRITKAMRFADVRHIIKGEPVEYGTTAEEAVAFIDNEVALLVKKNTTPSKPTAVQKENEGLKVQILDFLMGQADAVTCTEVQKGIPSFADFNNQKVAALMGQLVKAGKVNKSVVKGKSLFTIA